MTVKIGNARYRVRFRRITTCQIDHIKKTGEMQAVGEGVAKCHPSDESQYDGELGALFDVETGERLALQKALRLFIKADREEFWRRFCYRWGLDWPGTKVKKSKVKKEKAIGQPGVQPLDAGLDALAMAQWIQALAFECQTKHTQILGGCDNPECPNYIPFLFKKEKRTKPNEYNAGGEPRNSLDRKV